MKKHKIQVDLDPNGQSSSTIQWFLSNTPDGAYSIIALHAKASILFEQSFELTRSYDSSKLVRSISVKYHLNNFTNLAPPSETIQTWLLKWNTLQTLTQRFQSEVPSVESAESAAASRRLLVIHTLLCVTKIRVLRPLPAQVYDVSNENIRKVAIEAALLIRRVDLRETAFIDPTLAVSILLQLLQFSDIFTTSDALEHNRKNALRRNLPGWLHAS